MTIVKIEDITDKALIKASNNLNCEHFKMWAIDVIVTMAHNLKNDTLDYVYAEAMNAYYREKKQMEKEDMILKNLTG